MSKRNSKRTESHSRRQSERGKKARQYGEGPYEIHLERPPFPTGPRPITPGIETSITDHPISPVNTPEMIPFQPEPTIEGSLSHQPNRPGGPESR